MADKTGNSKNKANLDDIKDKGKSNKKIIPRNINRIRHVMEATN